MAESMAEPWVNIYYRICSYILNFGSTNGKGSSQDAWSLHTKKQARVSHTHLHKNQGRVEPTHSMGPNTRMPRTCVSLPFMWFARMMTWRMHAWIGLLRAQASTDNSHGWRVSERERKRGGKGKDDPQALAVVAWLRRDVERDPPVGTVQRDRAHFLQIAWARARTHRERRGRVRIVELVAEIEAKFLQRRLAHQPPTYTKEY